MNMEKLIILSLLFLLITVTAFAYGTSRSYNQKVVAGNPAVDILTLVTSTLTTYTAPNYTVTAMMTEYPNDSLQTGVTVATSIRLFKNGNGTTVPYYASITMNLGSFPSFQWAEGNHLVITVTKTNESPVQSVNWETIIPANTNTISNTNWPLLVPAQREIPPLVPLIDPKPKIAVNPSPDQNTINVAVSTTQLLWTYTNDPVYTDPTGYKVYFAPNNLTLAGVTPVVNEGIANTTFPVTLDYYTDYYWKIVPYNTNGDAINCPIWHFKTEYLPPLNAINPTPTNNQMLTWTGQQSISLHWQPNTGGGSPSGYLISWNGNSPIDIGNVTSWTSPQLSHPDYRWKIIPYAGIPGEYAYADSAQCPWWYFGFNVPYAQYSVSSISYGLVWTNHQAILPLTISNIGNADLEIDLLLASGAFSIINHPISFSIAPNQAEIINIGCIPTALQSYSKSLFIETNDPWKPNVIIPLTATGYILTADFTANPVSGDLPLLVNFTDQSSSTVHAWSWDFGDGSSSTLQNPEHIYTTKGVKNITLTVYDTYFNRSITKTITVIAHPLLSCTAPNHDFGTRYLGTTTDSTVTIHSTGTDSLLITNIHWKSGNPALHFSSPDIMKGILPGNSGTISVSFQPISTATISDSLIIETNAENIPIIRLKFTGKGTYVPPKEPENLQISMSGAHAQLSWDAVTQTIFDTPIVPDYYFIYFNGSSYETNPFYFLGLSHTLTYQHDNVGLGSEHMFYRVKAIKVYTRVEDVLRDIKPGMTEQEVDEILMKFE
jgi:PKD repeat protein